MNRFFVFFVYFEKILIRMALIFYPFSKLIRSRINFEENNQFAMNSIPGAKTIGFSLSSEGEFEQVLPIIQVLLSKYNYHLNLIYTSPSLTTKIEKYAEIFGKQVTISRLPILTYYSRKRQRQLLQKLLEVECFIFVRYDFYFFLLHCLIKANVPLVLLQAKGTDKFLKKRMFHLFKKISFSLKQDEIEFLRAHQEFDNKNVSSMDYRIFRIMERLSGPKQSKLFESLVQELKKIEPTRKIIFGSYYPQEKFLIESIRDDFPGGVALLVPHHLSHENLREIEQGLDSLNIIRISDETSVEQFMDNWILDRNKLNIVILNMRGVLCELYQSFELAYVGGGFGYSVHSILEPFLAGCFTIYGPQNKRSTEKETCAEIDPGRLAPIISGEEFSQVISLQREKTFQNQDFKNNIHSLYSSERLQSSIDWILE